MSWLHHSQSEPEIRLAQTGLSRRVLRHLILSHDIGIGSRILDIGCGTGELVRFFDQLGFKATGIGNHAGELAAAREAAPHLDFIISVADLHDDCSDSEQFDCILVRNSTDYAGNLFTAEAFRTTASLVSLLRPGGHLVFVQSHRPDARYDTTQHASSCFARHLAVFHGECAITDFPSGPMRSESWRWVLGHRPRAGVATVAFRRPDDSALPGDWHACAEEAALSHSGCCCLPALGIDSGSGSHQRAA